MSGAAAVRRLRVEPESPSLDATLVRGIAWTGAVKWGSQILSWASTIVVARLLLPSDYGLVAMATTFLALIALVNEFGIGSTIIALRTLRDEQIAQVNAFAVLMGLAGFCIAGLAAQPLGAFYRSPELPAVVVVLGSGFLIGSFRSVPSALLTRDLKFSTGAILEGGQAILLTSLTMALAWAGFGYWAIILGNVGSSVAATGVVLLRYGHRFAVPDWTAMKEVLSFSSHAMGTRVTWALASSADVFIAGRVFGQAALGAYTFAMTLANIPMEKVTGLVNQVSPAFYSAVQSDYAAIRRYFLRLTEGLALLTFPLAVGLAFVAEEAVPLILGEKWTGAIAPLGILAAYTGFRAISTLLPPILFVTGGVRFGTLNGLWALLLFPCAFYAGSRWGTIGIAACWIVVHPLYMGPIYWRVFRTIQATVAEYIFALRPALTGVCAMAVAVLVLKQTVLPNLSLPVRFAGEVLGGAAAYVLCVLGLHRDRCRKFVDLLKQARAGRCPA